MQARWLRSEAPARHQAAPASCSRGLVKGGRCKITKAYERQRGDEGGTSSESSTHAAATLRQQRSMLLRHNHIRPRGSPSCRSVVGSHRRPSEVMVHCFLLLDGCDHFLGASDSL